MSNELGQFSKRRRKHWRNKKRNEPMRLNQRGEKSQVEEKFAAVTLEDEMSQEIPEGAKDRPQEREKEIIKSCEGLGASLFYLQTVHMLGEKMMKFAAVAEGEKAPAERPPPVIDKSDGCCDEEEGPKQKKGRPKRRAARFIYWE